MKTYITIFGQPVGKQRHRLGKGNLYTPEKTRHYEREVRAVYLSDGRHHYGNAPLKMHILAFYKIPASSSKTARTAMLCGEIRPVLKPDVDNVAKIIMDALNGVAYDDDKQVVCLTVEKRYGLEGVVHVMITDEGVTTREEAPTTAGCRECGMLLPYDHEYNRCPNCGSWLMDGGGCG